VVHGEAARFLEVRRFGLFVVGEKAANVGVRTGNGNTIQMKLQRLPQPARRFASS